MSEILELNGNRYQFKSQTKYGRPSEETWMSFRFIPVNHTGELTSLQFGKDNFYVMRSYLNAILDGFVRNMYDFGQDGAVALYKEGADKPRSNGSIGYARSTVFAGPTEGVWGTQQLKGRVYRVRYPSLLNAKNVRVAVPMTTWVSIYKRNESKLVLNNTWVDAYTGECNAELKHDALLELLQGKSVNVPCTIGESKDGKVLDGLQNAVKRIYQELSLLLNGETTQDALRIAELARLAEYNQEDTASNREAREEELREQNNDPKPEPTKEEKSKLEIRVNGKVIPFNELKKDYYRVWPLTVDGKRLASPEYFMLSIIPGSSRALDFAAPNAYDLETIQ